MSADSDKRFYGGVVLGHSVEGGNFNSDWWRWEQRPGRIADGATSQTAADHWNRFDADFDLAGKLGLNCMLVSIEWARIEPKPGEFDRNAIDHYARVLKALNKRGITPIVALQAITLPAWFADQGGWEHYSEGGSFTSYVREIVTALLPLCNHWVPIYDDVDCGRMGYEYALWPPGRTHAFARFSAQNNARLAFDDAAAIIYDLDDDARVGSWINPEDVLPFDEESPWDYRVALDTDEFEGDGLKHGLAFAYDGSTPFEFHVVRMPGRRWVRMAPLSIRRWFTQYVDADGADTHAQYREPDVSRVASVITKQFSKNVPLLFVGGAYELEQDDNRCRYMLDHVDALDRLSLEGYRVMGYLHDAFLDGFEWHRGYSTRRGLIHVDWKTLSRTPNQSAYLLGDIARNGRITPGAVRKYCPGWEPALEHAT